MQHVGAAQARRAVHHGVRVENAIFAQHHVVTHDGIRPDAHSSAQARAGGNHSAWINLDRRGGPI
jgi:hypothetical protein